MLQTAPGRDRAINFLSHKGTEAHQWAAWHSLTHSQRVSFLGLVLLFCNSFQSGVNFFFQGCITPPLPPSFCALRWWKAQKACVSDPCSPPGLADSCRRALQHLLRGAASPPGDGPLRDQRGHGAVLHPGEMPQLKSQRKISSAHRGAASVVWHRPEGPQLSSWPGWSGFGVRVCVRTAPLGYCLVLLWLHAPPLPLTEHWAAHLSGNNQRNFSPLAGRGKNGTAKTAPSILRGGFAFQLFKGPVSSQKHSKQQLKEKLFLYKQNPRLEKKKEKKKKARARQAASLLQDSLNPPAHSSPPPEQHFPPCTFLQTC